MATENGVPVPPAANHPAANQLVLERPDNPASNTSVLLLNFPVLQPALNLPNFHRS